ncbi:MAG: hypothetical protein LBP65_02475 [Puniceicoccales bacterium]|jgi:hypothetical protein|nr:hypothetical protein [Puniceicoccales bacterium]
MRRDGLSSVVSSGNDLSNGLDGVDFSVHFFDMTVHEFSKGSVFSKSLEVTKKPRWKTNATPSSPGKLILYRTAFVVFCFCSFCLLPVTLLVMAICKYAYGSAMKPFKMVHHLLWNGGISDNRCQQRSQFTIKGLSSDGQTTGKDTIGTILGYLTQQVRQKNLENAKEILRTKCDDGFTVLESMSRLTGNPAIRQAIWELLTTLVRHGQKGLVQEYYSFVQGELFTALPSDGPANWRAGLEFLTAAWLGGSLDDVAAVNVFLESNLPFLRNVLLSESDQVRWAAVELLRALVRNPVKKDFVIEVLASNVDNQGSVLQNFTGKFNGWMLVELLIALYASPSPYQYSGNLMPQLEEDVRNFRATNGTI